MQSEGYNLTTIVRDKHTSLFSPILLALSQVIEPRGPIMASMIIITRFFKLKNEHRVLSVMPDFLIPKSPGVLHSCTSAVGC